jgi:hypothetical protein
MRVRDRNKEAALKLKGTIYEGADVMDIRSGKFFDSIRKQKLRLVNSSEDSLAAELRRGSEKAIDKEQETTAVKNKND